ncbi:peptide-N-glycosidase F-related protein [Sphingobacterium multivorum]|uniref:peptide-N-glycosidase F-related protein n=1 Tax=Sphingobacterium multivorum TaxID=28454 RepID=UPI003DA5CB4A
MNIRPILTLFCFFICHHVFAQQGTKSHVVTHQRKTILCDAQKGENSYPAWGVFPKENYPIRKVTMFVTLGSPDSLRTAHWDYLDHIVLRRKGGKNGPALNYELGRMLTPYGSIYNKGWSWKWQVDVTDFAPFLRDSVEIVYTHSGFEDKTVGWALTVDFEILSGPPVVTPLGITTLWNKAYKYGDVNEKIAENLLPITYTSSAGAALSRIRIQHTGHGMDKPRGCSEFCSRWRELTFDGKTVDKRDMWKKCGGNPLYPQGGTWVHDRAYWCPGDLQQPDFIDVFTKVGTHQIALQMEPYTATDNVQAVENISAYLFQYSAPKQKVDVAVESIMVPSDEQRFSRLNPASVGPRISFRNLGAEPIRTVEIVYGTKGFPARTFHWKGNLSFNQVAEVILPGEIQERDQENVFTVSLLKPNGKSDAWPIDNKAESVFNALQLFPTDFVLEFMTNNKPADNRIFLINAKQDTVFRKNGAQLAAATMYRDTLHLNEGNHSLSLADTAGNGLQFWAQPENGDGHLRIFDLKGNLIHAFESDCGNGEMFSFHAKRGFETGLSSTQYAFSLYPRSVVDKTQLSVVSNEPSEMTVLFMVDGVLWQKHEYKSIQQAVLNYDVSHLPSGRIIVEVLMDGISQFKGRINKR